MKKKLDEGELRALWDRAQHGDRAALRDLMGQLAVIVRCRVLRSLLRRRGASLGRDLAQEATDLTQEVIVGLFADGQRTLRAWDPERGLGLGGFVGFVAEREVASILRSRRRSPWSDDPTAPEDLEPLTRRSPDPESQVADRQLAEKLLERLRLELSPLGMQLFFLFWRDQKEVHEICEELSMSKDAVWAWRSRLRKRARAIAEELTSTVSAEAAQ